MNSRIVFQLPGRPVAVVIPGECGLTLEQIGQKDVPKTVRHIPTGVIETDEFGQQYEVHETIIEPTPFWVVDASAIPADRTFRDAWELDVASMGEPSGFGGAE